MDKVISDEQAAEILDGDPIVKSLESYNERLESLEKAMGQVMGFMTTVLPADFERYLKKELKLAERAGDVKELKV